MANDVRSRELLALAKKVALTNVTVFINGPTGTGKEVISNYIHNNSSKIRISICCSKLRCNTRKYA